MIRDLFASLPEAKARGFGADKFSFNTSDERCENCNGAGVVAVDMAFMPDVEMECPVCNGMRFNEELLSVKFQGHTYRGHFRYDGKRCYCLYLDEQQKIFALLDLMKQVGLEYLTLGQSTSTLSGGEAQRIKLAAELSKSGRESHCIYWMSQQQACIHRRWKSCLTS